METTDLERRARRAYELGRLSQALRVVPWVLLPAAVALLCGRPAGLVFALCTAALAVSMALLIRGGMAGRSVGPGLAAGWAALLPPLLLRTAGHACFGDSCMALGLPVCAAAGALSGILIGRVVLLRGGGAASWIGAGVLAGLTGAMGCSIGGTFGILGMIAGVVAGSAPVLVLARPGR
ncbi:MAG TPA: hypothetical protein VGH20_11580 [Myxococcales bacterium]|jgi:hypothetical protein